MLVHDVANKSREDLFFVGLENDLKPGCLSRGNHLLAPVHLRQLFVIALESHTDGLIEVIMHMETFLHSTVHVDCAKIDGFGACQYSLQLIAI